MNKIKACIVGFGNIGKFTYQAILSSPDIELAGIIRRNPKDRGNLPDNVKVVGSINELEKIDVAILATPTREVEKYASEILRLGINTVDSFDIHTQIPELRKKLNKIAKDNNAVSIIAAGWDPGSDSIVRALMEVMAPKGITYTNFGPGMSMGHTVAVKSIKGVKNALSMTIPLGTGIHRRMVYVEIEPGYQFDEIKNNIITDPYFASDETHVIEVADINLLKDMGHGVNMTRKGVSGETQNQLFDFNMKINNPALTGQILVAAARASVRLDAGCYTLIEIPVIDLLPGDRDQWISLV